jgi:hypothetical protein
MEIWTKTYSTHEVAAATDVSPATLQNWLKRGVVVGHNDAIEGGGIQGSRRRFSFYAIMQIGIASALIKASGGMDLKMAFQAAMHFAHTGDGGAGYTVDNAREPERSPGHPYHFSLGRTLLATVGENTTVVLNDPAGDMFGTIRNRLGWANGFTLIDAGDVFDRVCSALGEHPNEVMDAVYPEEVVA